MAKSAIVGALRVTMGIDTAAFEAGLDRVEKQLRTVGKRMQAVGKTMSASVSVPLALAGGAGLKFAADFEEAMSRAKAILRPTQQEFKALSDLALELGRTTKFTAAQAADGIEMLARNELKTAQILDGAAEATLNLAGAIGADLAPAADLITDVMKNFRLQISDLPKAADNIAGTLVSSKFDWEDYALAVGQAAGAAGGIGMSFEDMNAALAATASRFSSGVEAGTSLKGMLLKLAPSSKQSKQLIKEMGLEFWDAAGNLRSLADIAEELRVKLGDLTKEAQTEVLGALFGQRTIRTALGLMEEGRAGIERYKAALADVSAEQMAKDRLDNLNGAFLMLKSAVEGLAIAIAKAGLLEWVRGLTDGLTELTRSLADTNPAILRLVSIVGMVLAALGPIILIMGLFAAAIAAIGIPAAAMAAAIVGVTAVVTSFWSEITRTVPALGRLADELKRFLGLVPKQTTALQDLEAQMFKLTLRAGELEEVLADPAAHAASKEMAQQQLALIDARMAKLRMLIDLEHQRRELATSGWETTVEPAAGGNSTAAGASTLEDIQGVSDAQERLNQLVQEGNLLDQEAFMIKQSLQSPFEQMELSLQRIIELQESLRLTAEQAGQAQVQAIAGAASAYLGLAGQVASAMTKIFGNSKAAAIASAIVNTAQAVTRTLAVYGGTPFGWAAAAAAAASGAAQLATIRSTNSGGGGRTPSVRGGGGGEAPSQQMPSQTLTVAGIAPGQFFKGEAVRELVEELLQYQRDGGRVLIA